MNSKQRVRAALTRSQIPDRVPLQFDLCASHLEAFAAKHGVPVDYSDAYYEDLKYRISANDLRTSMGSDCAVVGAGLASGFRLDPDPDGCITNEFGMRMRQGALYMEVVEPPLADCQTARDLASFRMPDPHDPARYEEAKSDIARFGRDYFIIGDCELTMFEMSWQLVGMQKYMEDLAMRASYVEPLLAMAHDWSLGVAQELAQLAIDAIWFGDDFGSQTGLLMSPRMWRRVFKPLYAEIFGAVKSANPDILIIMHSDGAVSQLLPDLIEIGLDVFNPVQPNVPGHDPQALKDQFGDRLSFFGAIDQQNLLPNGTPDEIAADVRDKIKILGRNGGYMAAPAHIIQADTPAKNVTAFVDAVKQYGVYA